MKTILLIVCYLSIGFGFCIVWTFLDFTYKRFDLGALDEETALVCALAWPLVCLALLLAALQHLFFKAIKRIIEAMSEDIKS